MPRHLEGRGFLLPALPPDTLAQVQQALQLEKRRGGAQSLQYPSRLLQPVYDNLVAAHVSGETSHKFRNFADAIGIVENGQIKPGHLYSVENPNFDEDAQKAPIERILGRKLEDPDIISLCKADRQLSPDPEVRMHQIYEILAGQLEGDDLTRALSHPLIVSTGNDVMVYVEVRPGEFKALFKPNIQRPEDPEHMKQALFNYLQDFFRHLPRHFQIRAKATTTMTDMRSNLGLVATDSQYFHAQQPSMEALETLVFGITEHTSPRLAEVFLEVAAKAQTPGVWTPEEGLGERYILGVNGGLKMDHPLWILACTLDNHGLRVSREHFDDPEFLAQINQYQQVVLGYPTRLYELTVALVERLAVDVYGQESAQQSWVNLSREQQHILAQLAENGIRPTADWKALPSKKEGRVNHIEDEIERLARLSQMYQMIHQEQVA